MYDRDSRSHEPCMTPPLTDADLNTLKKELMKIIWDLFHIQPECRELASQLDFIVGQQRAERSDLGRQQAYFRRFFSERSTTLLIQTEMNEIARLESRQAMQRRLFEEEIHFYYLRSVDRTRSRDDGAENEALMGTVRQELRSQELQSQELQSQQLEVRLLQRR